MVIFYPLIDGGIEQIGQVFKQLFDKKTQKGESTADAANGDGIKNANTGVKAG
jgi:hypothetical protein